MVYCHHESDKKLVVNRNGKRMALDILDAHVQLEGIDFKEFVSGIDLQTLLMEQFLDRFVLVKPTGKVVDLLQPGGEAMTHQAFKQYAQPAHLMSADGKKFVYASAAWMGERNRKIADVIDWYPGKERYYKENRGGALEVRVLNTYEAPRFKEAV